MPHAVTHSHRPAPPLPSIDPWLVPVWRCSVARATCDGCGVRLRPVMRVEGGGDVGLCKKCHDEYMDAWRAHDAKSERDEMIADFFFR